MERREERGNGKEGRAGIGIGIGRSEAADISACISSSSLSLPPALETGSEGNALLEQRTRWEARLGGNAFVVDHDRCVCVRQKH